MDALSQAQQALSQDFLRPKPRAHLLVHLCNMASLLKQPQAAEYWENLQPLAANLPSEDQETYALLRAQYEDIQIKKQGRARGLAGEVAADVEGALEAAPRNDEALAEFLKKAEGRLRERWWWPFGLRPAWAAIVRGWAEVNGKEGFRLLKKVETSEQLVFLRTIYQKSPFSPEAWAEAERYLKTGMLVKFAQELIDAGKTIQLTPGLAKRILADLKPDFFAPWGEGDVETKRKIAQSRITDWISQVCKTQPEIADSLLRELYLGAVQEIGYQDKFELAFARLSRIINLWRNLPELQEASRTSLLNQTPAFLKSFVLSHWLGLLPNTLEEARQQLKVLQSSTKDQAEAAEAWFYVVLVRRGLCQEALTLAQEARKGDLLARVRRAFVCEYPDQAREILNTSMFAGDVVGGFLLGSYADKVAFLRSQTSQGTRDIPSELWSCPSWEDVLAITPQSAGHRLTINGSGLYKKDTPKSEQFSVYVRMNGYGYYSYGDVDRYLLGTLVFWEKEHPGETAAVISKMIGKIRSPKDDFVFKSDVLRNIAFERSRNVLAAQPQVYTELFVDWLKGKFVDRPYTWEEVNYAQNLRTTYTVRFKETAPFLYAVLSAQEVSRFSPQACSALIRLALKKYQADADLIKYAAELYSVEHGLGALQAPDMQSHNANFLDDWQMSVINSAKKSFAQAFMEKVMQGGA